MRPASQNAKSGVVRRALVGTMAASIAFAVAAPAHAALALPTIPLQAGSAVPPDILFLLDDSGSMQFEIMPEEQIAYGWSQSGSNWYAYYGYYIFPPPVSASDAGTSHANHTYKSGYYTGPSNRAAVMRFNESNHYNVILRSSRLNKIFYDPTITYEPWRQADGTGYADSATTAAPWNPAHTGAGTLDLTQQQTTRADWMTCNARTSCSFDTDERSYYPVTYYVYDGSGSDTDRKNYIRYQYRGGSLYKWEITKNISTESSVSTLTWGSTTRTVAQEVQNFANWFTYYRSRILSARAGATTAFADLGSSYRVGFKTINSGEAYTSSTATDTYLPIPTSGSFSSTNKENFFNRLVGAPIPAQGTPLREALHWAGQYYQRTDDDGPWGPSDQLSCRRAYTILTTDGYWTNNSDFAPVGNADNTDGDTYTGPNNIQAFYDAAAPYADSHSNTLADIAMQYWKTDLRTDLANEVPRSNDDTAFWQHMTTFGLSIGVQGSLDPETDLPALTSGSKSWPDPTTGNSYKIDDLWHATVNGRGSFVAASNPSEFADGLQDALRTIQDRTGAASNVSANSTQLNDGARVYQAQFKVSDNEWTGELAAYPVSTEGVSDTPSWLASEQMENIGHATREVFSWDGDEGIEFRWSQLTSAQQTALGSEDVLDYLRGDQSDEENGASGQFRRRTRLLGDIVNSSPAFNRDTDTIFVGANDGMLHAIDASTGAEVFAYVPGAIIERLSHLSDPEYTHEFFVDGEIAISSQSQTTNRNYLVAALGRGGKGLFGLDVTTPSSFDGDDVLWELDGQSDADMGYVLGEPIVTKTNSGDWVVVVGNGYNSSSEKAVLYVIRMSDGTVLAKLDTGQGSPADTNGLATPVVFDEDGNGTADYAYAGDLHGNMWKFDLSSTTAATWTISNSGAPLFTASSASGTRQPITGQAAVAVNPAQTGATAGQRFVMFGTGQYYTSSDPGDTSVQSWYGIIDDGNTVSGRSSLVARTITAEGAIGTTPVRAFSEAEEDDMENKDGWYIDLKLAAGTAEGERIVSASRVYTLAVPVLIASSIIPEQDACSAQGRGYLNAVDPFTGASVSTSIFDVNNDNDFTSGDELDNALVGSIDVGIGMPTRPVLIGNRLVVGGSKGEVGSIRVNLGGSVPTGTGIPGRISWREIIR